MAVVLRITAGVTVDAGQEQSWRLLVDWSRQREWIWATRTSGGHGTGALVSARTGIGPVGFTDVMKIIEWDPPRRCSVRHTGAVVRGHGIFEVRSLGGRSEVRWTEFVVLPVRLPASFERLVLAAIAPVARAGLGSSLARFARLLPAGG